MWKKFKYLWGLILLVSCNTSTSETRAINCDEIDSLQALTLKYFYSKPDSCLKILHILNEYLAQCDKSYIKRASNYLNIGSLYFEVLDSPKIAKPYLLQALDLYEKNNDTTGYANILKYLGLLYSKLDESDKGKRLITKSINLYTKLNNSKGVAVAKRNLAILYSTQGEEEKALIMLDSLFQFWLHKSGNRAAFIIRDYYNICKNTINTSCMNEVRNKISQVGENKFLDEVKKELENKAETN